MNTGRAILVLLALGCCAPLAALGDSREESLSMEFIEPEFQAQASRANDQRWTIYLDGRIDDGAAQRFRDEIARRDIRSASVILNSQGGNLGDGIELGRLVRQNGFSTYLGRQSTTLSSPSPAVCYSACVLTYIGGKYRFYSPPARIGVHRFSPVSPADADSDQVQMVSAAIVNYIRDMQVDVGLFDRMSRAGKDQILVLPLAELEKLRVVNHGRLAPEWSFDSMNGKTYLKGAQQTALGSGEILLSCRERQAIFDVRFHAGDNADAVADPMTEHTIGFGSGFLPLGEPLTAVAVNEGSVTAEFALTAQQIQQLRVSKTVGYAARLRHSNERAGFTIDSAGSNPEKISSFLKSCEN